MKFRLLMLFAAGILLHCGQANADVFIVGVSGSASAGGTTQDISISGTNIRPGGS